ncbi:MULTISPECIES: ABC transporter permease [Bradyrhizobium]|uniref:ABC transporter permease n=1 Tax=Bradyrhizobium TaxID=374 RepID=UPI00155E4677|nr:MULTISPECIES: ABC transporter permease [Bradyrhizobium]MDD1521595.1 peptide ABC transporter permease [Bradyrhizobium sp. WBAH30]MDD1546002.1 peptide ABC transporter permease [Bradyrhizobium sp. WBAH41]MDD1559204.1 peptide ABC transporter permease [Bradyrhizobium sp. WBAH23]MDD1566720.1 peptide ABC transporter permease [Bradyrhizobium sp. WBAH33]MDD1592594.1 peptide ABC transporter permease [Bradyrhizobium sp. WBAH42]
MSMFAEVTISRSLKEVLAITRHVPFRVTVSLIIIGLFAFAAMAPKVLQTHDPLAIDLRSSLQSPSIIHWLGTDQLGRDLYSRIVEGTGQSLAIGLGATALSMSIAIVFGVAAALSGGVVDSILSRIVDVLFAIPTLLLALVFVTVFGPSVVTEVIAVGIGTAPGYARMIRGQMLAIKGTGYVEAAKVLGHPFPRIVWRHILPNAMSPLTAMMTIGVGQAIIWASGLAFLGLGVAPPAPEWGALLNAGRNYVIYAWWLEIIPGLAVTAFALSVTIVGRHLQDRLEGKT